MGRTLAGLVVKLLVAGVATVGVGGGCDTYTSPQERHHFLNTYKIVRHSVDQVFRDNDGYRAISRGDDGKIYEKKFLSLDYYRGIDKTPFPILNPEDKERFKCLESATSHVQVYFDLEPGTRGYVDVIHYQIPEKMGGSGCFPKDLSQIKYVSIHMPKSDGLSPGNDAWKISRHETEEGPMHEIK